MPAFDNYSENPPAEPYASGQVTVGTSATLVCTVPANTSGGVLISTTVACYIGGSAVTTTTGLPIPVGTPVLVPTLGDYQCQLYAVSASSSVVSFCYPTA